MIGLKPSVPIPRTVYRRTSLLPFLCSALLCPNRALAQSAAVSGRVIDPSGAIVANAEITLKREGTGDSRSTKSNSDGLYAFPFVRAGKYTLIATADGFKRSEQEGVMIETG